MERFVNLQEIYRCEEIAFISVYRSLYGAETDIVLMLSIEQRVPIESMNKPLSDQYYGTRPARRNKLICVI
jgi:hypothetical protein